MAIHSAVKWCFQKQPEIFDTFHMFLSGLFLLCFKLSIKIINHAFSPLHTWPFSLRAFPTYEESSEFFVFTLLWQATETQSVTTATVGSVQFSGTGRRIQESVS